MRLSASVRSCTVQLLGARDGLDSAVYPVVLHTVPNRSIWTLRPRSTNSSKASLQRRLEISTVDGVELNWVPGEQTSIVWSGGLLAQGRDASAAVLIRGINVRTSHIGQRRAPGGVRGVRRLPASLSSQPAQSWRTPRTVCIAWFSSCLLASLLGLLEGCAVERR
jgi:hypothetical protein